MEKGAVSAFIAMVREFVLGWNSGAAPPLPQSLFPCSAPDTNRVILFCGTPPDPSKRGEHIPGYKAALLLQSENSSLVFNPEPALCLLCKAPGHPTGTLDLFC